MRKILLFLYVSFLICSCSPGEKSGTHQIITVSGLIDPDSLGITLTHEHVLVDFIGADSTGFHRWDKDEVVDFLLPHLLEARQRGVKTIVECTPSFLGKDPELLQMLTAKTGIQFITNTGFYGAVEGKYLPQEIHHLTAKELSDKWVNEFRYGINDTDIRPGFIKIGVNEGDKLSEIDQKLVQAAANTHKQTGLLILSHTGPWNTAKAQIEILKDYGVNLSNFVWVHAHIEQDFEKYKEAVREGVWISLDGIVWDVEGHLDRLVYFKENLGLDRVMISHDAGWFSPGEADQSGFKGYISLFDDLIPKLLDTGFTQDDINLMLIKNPSMAFKLNLEVGE
jgi:phosphotriesterase-related protein